MVRMLVGRNQYNHIVKKQPEADLKCSLIRDKNLLFFLPADICVPTQDEVCRFHSPKEQRYTGKEADELLSKGLCIRISAVIYPFGDLIADFQKIMKR